MHIATPEFILTTEQALAHWQGHRNLTRRTIETFSNDKLFTYSLGDMRPFSELIMEMIYIAAPGAKGIRSEEHTSELQSRGHLVCRLLLEKKKKKLMEAIQ